jgi:hypothetical protein
MTPKDKAEKLVDTYRIILMDEDTDCGNEVLCTLIAKKCALIAVDEVIQQCWDYRDIDLEASYDYWQQVKQEILAL